MEIKTADPSHNIEITELYIRSQAATQLPNPAAISPSKLGELLYSRDAIERYVAIEAGEIVGHAAIENPNNMHEPLWRQRLVNKDQSLIEIGGIFVEPRLYGNFIGRALLQHSLIAVRKLAAVPVAATWSSNIHFMKVMKLYGGIDAGSQSTPLGDVKLFVFETKKLQETGGSVLS
jgi:GNAT superfamily N-acetyltransferase